MAQSMKQNGGKLLYWKKVILAAESYKGTRIEWMRLHGIKESNYYYWHRILLQNGMLNDQDDSLLDGIELPPAIGQNGFGIEQTGFVEYRAGMAVSQASVHPEQPGAHRAPMQIVIEKNGYHVHVCDGFSPAMLCQILEVVAHAE